MKTLLYLIIKTAVKQHINQIYKEWGYFSGSMEYIEIGKWAVYVDYSHKGAKPNGSLIDLEIDIREVWSSKNINFNRIRNYLSKIN